jgi:DNA helicase-2/ATP-dependent DNA helicase PcrA
MSRSIRPDQIARAGDVQRAAASDPRRWVRLVAGPGTGKSFSIEGRVLWLLQEGVDASTIFGTSFTRLAASDLKARVREACEKSGFRDGVSVSTLHSLALSSLKAGGRMLGYGADPVVLDGWELKELFDREFAHFAGRITRGRAGEIREYHEAFWYTGKYELPPFRTPPDPPISESERNQFRAFLRPHTDLYACVLPGELVQMCVQDMKAGTLNPVELLDLRHLIVDEFQDLNPMDLDFVYRMEALGASLFVAGDDDQSLYQFRYAHPIGIQKFVERFEAAGDHVLRDCFRCTPEVLGAAETLIRSFPAPNRIEKEHVSLYADSDPVIRGAFPAWKFRDADDEALAIAASCKCPAS